MTLPVEALRRLRNFDVPVTRQTGSAAAPSDSPLHCTLRVSSGSWIDHKVLPFIPERATTVTEGLETPGRGRKERVKSLGIRDYVHAAFGLCT